MSLFKKVLSKVHPSVNVGGSEGNLHINELSFVYTFYYLISILTDSSDTYDRDFKNIFYCYGKILT